jgi:nucleoside 2-deoxyribosyltransferase
MTIKVYLSGPMYLGKEQAITWRNEFKEIINSEIRRRMRFNLAGTGFIQPFHITFFDPCTRFYDDKEYLYNNSGWIVKIDKMEIEKSDVVVVNANDPGWGTPMEQYIAYTTGKFVIAFSNCEFPSIWVKEHSHILVDTHLCAAKQLIQKAEFLWRV